MSRTIVFKPEFEAKLKKLKIKTKFVKNWKANKWKVTNPIYQREKANSADNWEWFIIYAFSWQLAPEGHDYWEHISDL
jgi:hypothetical protein